MQNEVYKMLIEELINACEIKDYVEIRRILIRLSIYNNSHLIEQEEEC